MKYMALIFFAIIIVFFAGCNAENPVCTENFCFVGEAFPRSELETGQEFSEVDIDDSVIFATLITGTTPVETTPAVATTQPDAVTLAGIVSDVATNGVNSDYKGQTVTVTATVRFVFEATEFTNTGVTLHTHNETISFFVDDPDGADGLLQVSSDTTYVFNIKIDDIKPNTGDANKINIWSDITQPPTQADIDIQNIALADLVADAATGGQTYVGKTVRLQARVSIDNATLGNIGGISLSTGNPKVSLLVLDVINPEKMSKYKSLTTYQFVLYIQSIKASTTTVGNYNIDAGIADD